MPQVEVLGITGHRPPEVGGYETPNPIYNFVRAELDKAFIELQPKRVLLGMALGVDQWAAELCIFNGIPFWAILPHGRADGTEGLEMKWPRAAQARYHHLLQRAERIHVVSPGEYAARKLMARNEWIVDHCNVLLAVFNGSPGGTANCVAYAMSRRTQIRYITPPSAFAAPAPPPNVEEMRQAAQLIARVGPREHRVFPARPSPEINPQTQRIQQPQEPESRRDDIYQRRLDLA